MTDKRILLIIGGGIAAYKALLLIRLLRGAGAAVTPVLTRAGAEFVTPLSVSALAGAAGRRQRDRSPVSRDHATPQNRLHRANP
ncbi:MAG: hypothetical protein K2P70_17435 [Hyphomonadaceae bacterium]|nr:hypothetical protein [Hyphomonadaceae bacterium]